MEFSTLPIARYRLHFQVTQPIMLPDYAGSTLRGAFGRALRKISCMTKLADCKGCPLYRTCPYTNIFETPAPESHHLQKFSQVPNGYIIEPPQWGKKQYDIGEELSFNLVLFGRLIDQLALIVFAFKRAFEYQVANGQATFIDIQHITFRESKSILKNGHIIDHNTVLSLPKHLPTDLTLQINTPLRLQENGKVLSATTIHFSRLLLGLAKRIVLLNEFHHQPIQIDFEPLKHALADIKDDKQLEWRDWTRYSSRQNQRMQLGGLVGQWHLQHVSSQWATLLYIGQWLHCGKNATFGLGQYEITNL
ncbi:TPA: CRISPR system precrRNA processing endoribonuclease RAMP protein Cas6 [Pasteurella multocida]|nr:CRISPR system precrRNA processing endoribonuclease RAMP protein Cas6 [Pasteurella multocida]HDR1289480.1 CRISPR system precrRNA processing endoribonuclease RAMP protein Cas6 [Pasteurella multocida]